MQLQQYLTNFVNCLMEYLFSCFGLLIIPAFLILGKTVLDFTKALDSMDDLRTLIRWSYFYTLFFLIFGLVPFILLEHFDKARDYLATSPIGVVKGCVETTKGEKRSSFPPDMLCPNPNDNDNENKTIPHQWLINNGGSVTEIKLIETNQAGPLNENVDTPRKSRIYKINGGLVVPLYFVVLSVLGAVVSMTRKIPEIQQEASSNNSASLDGKKMEKARELLIFQILQVLSAPMIAVAAFHLVSPHDRSGIVILGFFSGFASETILLMIRASADKIGKGLKTETETTKTINTETPDEKAQG